MNLLDIISFIFTPIIILAIFILLFINIKVFLKINVLLLNRDYRGFIYEYIYFRYNFKDRKVNNIEIMPISYIMSLFIPKRLIKYNDEVKKLYLIKYKYEKILLTILVLSTLFSLILDCFS